MKKTIILILCFLTVLFSACDPDAGADLPEEKPTESTGTPAPTPSVSEPIVYCAGIDGTTGVYWKDNGYDAIELVVLEHGWTSGAESDSTVNDILVSDGKVYMAGVYLDTDTPYPQASLWTADTDTSSPNIVRTTLSNDNKQAEAKAVFVYSTDVYICGSGERDTSTSKAMYWKDREIKEVIGAPEGSHAVAIAVPSANVYTAGSHGIESYTATNGPTTTVAAYWMDNIKYDLTNGSENAHVYDMTAVR